jgi:hypothetical protein
MSRGASPKDWRGSPNRGFRTPRSPGRRSRDEEYWFSPQQDRPPNQGDGGGGMTDKNGEIAELRARLEQLESGQMQPAGSSPEPTASGGASSFDDVDAYDGSVGKTKQRVRKPIGAGSISAVLGWAIGAFTILGGVATISTAAGYRPYWVIGIFALVAGAIVLPPVTALARKAVPILRPAMAPPVAYILVVLIAQPFRLAVEPHGAARTAYIGRAITRADDDIKAHNASGASNVLAPFAADAATDPTLKAALARVSAEQSAETSASIAAASAPSASPASGSASESETPEHKANSQAIVVDMARIYDTLRDPSGVTWGTMTGARNGTTLCGSVNAHNAFGGYTGQRQFIFDQAVGDPGLPAGRDAYLHWQEHPGFAREWKRLCMRDPNAVTVDGQMLAGQVEAIAPMARDSGQ